MSDKKLDNMDTLIDKMTSAVSVDKRNAERLPTTNIDIVNKVTDVLFNMKEKAKKKIVVKIVIVKEDLNSTLDMLATDISSINTTLLKAYTKIKLIKEMTGFNIGQFVFGIAIGTILGFVFNIVTKGVL